VKKIGLLFVILVLISTSCSSVNTEEVKTKATEAFINKDYAEFNNQYNILLKADEKIAVSYLNEIQENDVFIIDNYTSKNELEKGITELGEIKTNSTFLSSYVDVKITDFQSKIDFMTYTENRDTIFNKIKKNVNDLKSVIWGIYVPASLLDSLENVDTVISEFEKNISATGNSLLDLEELNTPEVDKSKVSNVIESLKEFNKSLLEKENYIKENKINLVAYNKAFLEGNIFSVTKSVEHSGEVDKLTNNIKKSVEQVLLRIERF